VQAHQRITGLPSAVKIERGLAFGALCVPPVGLGTDGAVGQDAAQALLDDLKTIDLVEPERIARD
jgi:hypothetical protein